jgi:hypothetical protein
MRLPVGMSRVAASTTVERETNVASGFSVYDYGYNYDFGYYTPIALNKLQFNRH